MKSTLRPSLAILVAIAVALTLTWVGAADATRAAPTQASVHTATTSAPAARKIAKSPRGSLGSRIVGHTKSGRRVTGVFIPLHFSRKNGHVRVRGLVNGVVHRANGRVVTFSAIRTLRVKSISGTPISARPLAGRTAAAAAAPACNVLNLVLGPLDLDLLGLQVHLDRVVLNIVAQSGAGNLLGNLLCSVAGLLDGGLGGLLGQLSSLLNQILGALRLGV